MKNKIENDKKKIREMLGEIGLKIDEIKQENECFKEYEEHEN